MSKLTFSVFSFFISFSSFSQKDWELAKEKNGIKVYSKYNSKAGIKELKCISIFNNTKLSTIFAIFKDVENSGKWTKDLKYSKILKEISLTESYEYYQIFVPFPFQNRDVIYHIQYSFDEKDRSLNLKATCNPTFAEEEKGVVRITDSFGSWKFTQMPNGAIRVENHLFADPKGFPAWIVNIFAIESPIKVISALKEFCKLPQYQNKNYSFIKE